MDIPLSQIDDLRTLVAEHGWSLPGTYRYHGHEQLHVDVVRGDGAEGYFAVQAYELDDMATSGRNIVRQRVAAAAFRAADDGAQP